ncbi:hypothetical protein LJR066_001675 [Acidovorax sp. LjRoot66]|uniref:hypothetical protein n=1 Tax=Acidovorax sp. LjRoot66 TaxID=3342334 RepID=UPI0012F9FD5C
MVMASIGKKPESFKRKTIQKPTSAPANAPQTKRTTVSSGSCFFSPQDIRITLAL